MLTRLSQTDCANWTVPRVRERPWPCCSCTRRPLRSSGLTSPLAVLQENLMRNWRCLLDTASWAPGWDCCFWKTEFKLQPLFFFFFGREDTPLTFLKFNLSLQADFPRSESKTESHFREWELVFLLSSTFPCNLYFLDFTFPPRNFTKMCDTLQYPKRKVYFPLMHVLFLILTPLASSKVWIKLLDALGLEKSLH